MRAITDLALLASVAAFLSGFATPNILGGTPPRVELHLSTNVAERHVGGPPVHVRVELWNKGKEDFIAGAEFAPILNAPSYVNLEFTDEKGAVHEGSVIYSNFTEDTKSQWWTRVAPGHYYGAEWDLDSTTYQFLDTPGLYKLTARYVSKGGDFGGRAGGAVVCCRVWSGEVISNTMMIRILPSTINQSVKH